MESALLNRLLDPRSELHIESLLDAVTAILHDCKIPALRHNANVQKFINRYQNVVEELNELRMKVTDFQLVQVIGRGAFGEVQLVRHMRTNTVHAMKILHKDDMLKRTESAFFWEERDVMAKADSDWIVRLHYAFQDYHYLYMVMEYMPGGDLGNMMATREVCLPEEWTRFYTAEIVEALAALHSMGFIHRDVKPDNILISKSGHIKLADFGTCVRMNSRGTVCWACAVGTPDYIAPEALKNQGQDCEFGVEVDWWSLGVFVYEMVYGEVPFYAESVVETYSNIMNHETNLKFPEDASLSPHTVGFIKGLLCSCENRLGRGSVEEIRSHPFFVNDKWNFDTLKEAIPPFVPMLDGDDDTKNFCDVENTERVESVQIATTFSGRQLPFIGFTFSGNLRADDTDRKCMQLNSNQNNINELEPSKIEDDHRNGSLTIGKNIRSRKSYANIPYENRNEHQEANDEPKKTEYEEFPDIKKILLQYQADINIIQEQLVLEKQERCISEADLVNSEIARGLLEKQMKQQRNNHEKAIHSKDREIARLQKRLGLKLEANGMQSDSQSLLDNEDESSFGQVGVDAEPAVIEFGITPRRKSFVGKVNRCVSKQNVKKRDQKIRELNGDILTLKMELQRKHEEYLRLESNFIHQLDTIGRENDDLRNELSAIQKKCYDMQRSTINDTLRVSTEIEQGLLSTIFCEGLLLLKPSKRAECGRNKKEWIEFYAILDYEKLSLFPFLGEEFPLEISKTPQIIIKNRSLCSIRSVTGADVRALPDELTRIFHLMYDDTASPKTSSCNNSLTDKHWGHHDFQELSYHMLTYCSLCNEKLSGQFQSPAAYECRRCRYRIHKDHTLEADLPMCKFTSNANELIFMAPTAQSCLNWVATLNRGMN